MAAVPILRIRQGESKRIVLPCIKPNGDTVNVADAIGIIVYLKVNGKVAAKFSYVEQQGYGSVTIPNGSDYFIEVQLTRAQTQSMPIGAIMASILVQTSDPLATDGVAYTEFEYQVATLSLGTVTREFMPR